MLDLDENTKRLQQAYSKANHKARRMAQARSGGLAVARAELKTRTNPETSGIRAPPGVAGATTPARMELLKRAGGGESWTSPAPSPRSPGGYDHRRRDASRIAAGSKPLHVHGRPTQQHPAAWRACSKEPGLAPDLRFTTAP